MAGTVNGMVAGYDGSPGSQQAPDWAAWEARARGLVLTVCHVRTAGGAEPRGQAGDLAWRYAQRVVAGGVQHAQGSMGAGDVRPLLLSGPPVRVLCEVSGNADMVVLGARGRGVWGMMPASVSLALLHHAPCPVAVVH
jgi:nucleotide-binding universal stress UspA family protein